MIIVSCAAICDVYDNDEVITHFMFNLAVPSSHDTYWIILDTYSRFNL